MMQDITDIVLTLIAIYVLTLMILYPISCKWSIVRLLTMGRGGDEAEPRRSRRRRHNTPFSLASRHTSLNRHSSTSPSPDRQRSRNSKRSGSSSARRNRTPSANRHVKIPLSRTPSAIRRTPIASRIAVNFKPDNDVINHSRSETGRTSPKTISRGTNPSPTRRTRITARPSPTRRTRSKSRRSRSILMKRRKGRKIPSPARRSPSPQVVRFSECVLPVATKKPKHKPVNLGPRPASMKGSCHIFREVKVMEPILEEWEQWRRSDRY